MAHDVSDVWRFLLVHHVVMLVDMQYVRRLRQVELLDESVPMPQNLVVLLDDKIGRAFGPLEQVVEPLPWIVMEIKEIQVDVEN